MSTEKMREEFESWARRRGLGIGKDYSGGYGTDAVRVAWESWQASRAAIEVDLSEVRKTTALPDRTWLLGNDVLSTIESLGLKVKP